MKRNVKQVQSIHKMQNTRRILGVVLMFCMVLTLALSTVTQVEAASKYKKKISKTVELTYGEEMEYCFKLKKKGNYVVTVSAKNKDGDYETCNILILDGTIKKELYGGKTKEGELGSSGYCENTENYDLTKLTIKSYGKGDQRIVLSGTGKFKITVTAKKAVLKFKSYEKYEYPEDVG